MSSSKRWNLHGLAKHRFTAGLASPFCVSFILSTNHASRRFKILPLSANRITCPMRVLFGFLGVIAAVLTAQAEPSLVGHVLDKVVCGADETQSYALYVPSTYTNQKKWPVIFCFDASARGAVPVEHLQMAAEKYGYIVAGSLNSRNGPWTANSVAIRAMFKDVGKHFALDPQRIYTAGVSGGARVATAVAISGLAKGVIACSAGFPVPETIPDRVPFPFFSTAGAEDFNYAEMQRLDQQLEHRKALHRLVVFNGGHEWASAELMTEAVEWLELQAMRTGAESKNEEFIQAVFRRRQAAMPATPALERWRALRSLIADFAGIADTRDLERGEKELSGSREIKDELKAERSLISREEKLVNQIADAAMERPVRKQKLAEELRRQTDQPEDSLERRMVRRAIATYISMTRESVHGLLEQQEYDRAAGMLEMSAVLRPKQARTLFDLARAYALNGERKLALESLEQAATAGFRDAAVAEMEPAFAKLRDDSRFKEILAKIRSNVPRPEGPMLTEVATPVFLDQSMLSFGPNPPLTAQQSELAKIVSQPTQSSGERILQLPVLRVSAILASVELRPFHLPNPESDNLPISFLRVERVRADTAAAQAGVEAGMEITAIQGVRLRGMTDSELSEAMAQPVKNGISLSVRDPPRSREREIQIVLKKSGSAPAEKIDN